VGFRRKTVLFATAALAFCVLISPALADVAALRQAVERVADDGNRRGARVAVHVVAPASGRVVYSRLATEQLIPASNEKLVTAAAALLLLGQDYKFTTRLCSQGAVQDGVLRGDLILRGGGDPTIGGRYDDEDAGAVFRAWAQALKARGIRHVTGGVVADDLFFDRAWYHPSWPPEQAWKWYFPPTSALSINDNCVTITVKPGAAPGAGALLALEPDVAPVDLLNACKTSSTRHAIWFERRAGSPTVKVGGFVKQNSAGYSHGVTVPNPPLYAASTLLKVLREEGIAVDGEAHLVTLEEAGQTRAAGTLCERRTPLLPVLHTMMRRSHNHYAEQVVKTLGAETSGAGSWQNGLSCAAALLEAVGFARDEFHLDDGSGLSRGNRLAPVALTSLLAHVHRSTSGATFKSLLAVPGQAGTLEHRLSEPPYAASIRAKTGYLDGVGALSGYATTRAGTEVAFSILVNDSHNPPGTYSMRQTVDTICRAIVDHAE